MLAKSMRCARASGVRLAAIVAAREWATDVKSPAQTLSLSQYGP